MPKDEFDLEDPLEGVAVEVPAEEDTLTPMAECFIEEFMRMGYSAERILGLFTNPMYAGPLLFTQARETAAADSAQQDVAGNWGDFHLAVIAEHFLIRLLVRNGVGLEWFHEDFRQTQFAGHRDEFVAVESLEQCLQDCSVGGDAFNCVDEQIGVQIDPRAGRNG